MRVEPLFTTPYCRCVRSRLITAGVGVGVGVLGVGVLVAVGVGVLVAVGVGVLVAVGVGVFVAVGVARVSVSVAELLPGVGSVTPPGADTVPVLLKLPVAAAEIVQLEVYVTLPPAGRLMVSLRLPDPDAVHVPPPAPTHVHVHVREAG